MKATIDENAWSTLSTAWQRRLSEAWATKHRGGDLSQIPWLEYKTSQLMEYGSEVLVHHFVGVSASAPPAGFYEDLQRLHELSIRGDTSETSSDALDDLSPLSMLPSLRSLMLANGRFESLSALASLTELVNLRMQSCSGFGLDELGWAPKLQTQALTDMNFDALDALAQLSSVTTLDLRLPEVQSLEGIAPLPLTHLFIYGMKQLTSLEPLRNKGSLRELGIHFSPVDDAGLEVIGTLDQLRVLRLGPRCQDIRELRPLLGLPLERLDVGSLGVDDSRLETLLSFQPPLRLTVQGCRLSEAALDKLRQRYGGDHVFGSAHASTR